MRTDGLWNDSTHAESGLLSLRVRQIHASAWRLVLLSAALQVVIFPLPGWYWLAWVAVAPLLIALLRAQPGGALQVNASVRLVPASPWQGFVLAYACGILWYFGTCYWVYGPMHRYGGLSVPVVLPTMLLAAMHEGLYRGLFGLLVATVAGRHGSQRRALVAAPFLWVAAELALTRISAFPWELLGYAQTGNFVLTRLATLTGVYGLSWEIMLVNSVFAAAFLVSRERRKWLLASAIGAAAILQAGQWIAPAPAAANHTALLVQQNIPIQADWTRDYFENTLRDLTSRSVQSAAQAAGKAELIVWPESPSPFYTSDPLFQNAVSAMARQAQTWVVAGAIGVEPAMHSGGQGSKVFNSAALVSPQGEWVGRYDKVHLVPFGEYLPFPRLFSFLGDLTKEIGEFARGTSRRPLDAGGTRLGVFICYESVFPDEVRQFALQGAQVFVNISNDGWYGDSGAWKQHLQQTEMRAIENNRWVLLTTNTGLTAAIDPWGRVVAQVPRKEFSVLMAPYALVSGTTFYTRHGDWFAYLCAIISVGAVAARFLKIGSQ
ncbi:MAG: apolipoprotein N-acyltransferase [Acidobacteriia bacterium]|nr:apolipoprotein N-acyltransferase [Terriglobia bacterium]